MNILIGTIVWIFCFGLRAESDEFVIDYHQRESIDLATTANPQSSLKRFRAQLDDPTLEQDPIRFVRTIYGISLTLANHALIPGLVPKLDKAANLAEQLNLHHEFIIISFFAQGMTYMDNSVIALVSDSAEKKQKYQAMIHLAEEKKAFAAAVFLRLGFANFLRDTGQKTQSMQVLVEGAALLAEQDTSNELLKIKLKSWLALSLTSQGQLMKAQQLFLEINEYCKRVELLDFCLTNLYNSGKVYAKIGTPETIRQAEQHFRQALSISVASKYELIEASIRNGMIRILHQQGQFQQAEEEGLRAVQLFTKLRDPIWQADSYKHLATMYLAWNKPEQAISFAEKSRQVFPADFSSDLMELDEVIYLANRTLKRWPEAFEALERYTSSFKVFAQEKQDDIYTKAKVDMGLQVEEERNSALKAANEYQKRQLKDAERLRQLLIIVCCAVLGIAASLLHSLRQAKLIRKQKILMQRILDNMEEGLLTLNPSYS